MCNHKFVGGFCRYCRQPEPELFNKGGAVADTIASLRDGDVVRVEGNRWAVEGTYTSDRRFVGAHVAYAKSYLFLHELRGCITAVTVLERAPMEEPRTTGIVVECECGLRWHRVGNIESAPWILERGGSATWFGIERTHASASHHTLTVVYTPGGESK